MSSWNKPSDEQAKSKDERGKVNVSRSIVAGLLVVIVAVACWFFLAPSEPAEQDKESKSSSLIKETTPAAAPTNKVEKQEKKIPFWKLDASHTNGFDKAMLRKWEIEHRPRMPVPEHEPAKKPEYWIFEHKSENLIAELLCTKPGTGFIGRPNYRGLNADFLKSCQEPIIVSKDDSEFVADLKRQVTEVKKDLKPRIDAGENLGDIIEETREEFRQIAEYKRMLEKELREKAKDPDASAEDIEDFQKAVNVMLEKKGVAPVKLSPFALKRLEQKKGMKE